MAGRMSEAERLHRCKVVFERSLADGISMAEADKRISLERIAERHRRIEALRRSPIVPRAAHERTPLWWQDPDR